MCHNSMCSLHSSLNQNLCTSSVHSLNNLNINSNVGSCITTNRKWTLTFCTSSYCSLTINNSLSSLSSNLFQTTTITNTWPLR